MTPGWMSDRAIAPTRAKFRAGSIGAATLREIEDAAICEVVRMQRCKRRPPLVVGQHDFCLRGL
jgi:hypothetical protein